MLSVVAEFLLFYMLNNVTINGDRSTSVIIYKTFLAADNRQSE